MELSEISSKLKSIYKEFKSDIDRIEIDEVYIKYLGKKGEINKLFKNIKESSPTLIKDSAKEINELKDKLQEEVSNARRIVKNARNHRIDLTTPVEPTRTGNYHPISLVKIDLYNFFKYYGFSVYEGPEIETDYYNFEMLGVPKDHPARELQDTFYIYEPEFLLRTQTSSIESRILEKMDPPIRFVSGGKVFRNETASRSNTSMFHQFQGVYVDQNVTMGNLKWLFHKSLKYILGEDTEIRFRSKYYPEVEPGMSPDIKCKFCSGNGCEICKQRGWVEIAGGGMIFPKTLESAGIDPKIYSGLAFGWGLDRIAMAKYGINDIRPMYDGSLVYN